jgi:capsular polysaccharide biosynthesis protein
MVVLGLFSSDVLLALAMWLVAFVLQGVLGRWPLSAIAIASIVPNVAAWIGVRAALGLYPGYGLDQVEELRRQTYALLATLTIITVFAFASQLSDSLPRPFLFAWALGLLIVAPVVRHYVKASLLGGVGQSAQAMTRVVDQPNEGGSRGRPAISPVITEEAAKEKELLEALGCRWVALLLGASEQLYGVMLVLYPKAFRIRYAPEMRQDFAHLLREGLEEGGAKELARVWVAAFSDLALSALEERYPVLERNAEQPVEVRVPAWLTVFIVFVVGLTLTFSLYQRPTYESSVKILVGQSATKDANLGGDVEGLQDLTLTVAKAANTMPVAQAVVEQLNSPEQSAGEVLQNMTSEPDPGTLFVNISYEDSDPKRAQLSANAIGQALSEKTSEVSPGANGITATVWKPATLPQTPVSPHPVRNTLLALVLGVTIYVGRAFAWPRIAASVIGQTDQAMMGRVDQVATEEAAKEKELLEALRRRRELTAAGAALETSLTVEEAERLLSALAAKGHLEVTVERGRLLYSLWEGDAPL